MILLPRQPGFFPSQNKTCLLSCLFVASSFLLDDLAVFPFSVIAEEPDFLLSLIFEVEIETRFCLLRVFNNDSPLYSPTLRRFALDVLPFTSYAPHPILSTISLHWFVWRNDSGPLFSLGVFSVSSRRTLSREFAQVPMVFQQVSRLCPLPHLFL